MADVEKVIKGLECCQMRYECKPYEKCQYSNGLECGDCDINQLHYDALSLLKEQNQRIWELLTKNEQLEEDIKKQISHITGLEDTIRQLNELINDLSKHMTPYGMVKDVKAYAESLKEPEPETELCDRCGRRRVKSNREVK